MSSSIKRKSAAVMFTDIAGYTNLMATDEEKALSLLHTKRDIIKPLIEKYDGIYVKGTGDGTLSYFESAYKASKCAKTFQENVYDNNDMNVRVGIHIGDIVFEEEDVYGDGVNVAARLESMAPVGGICVSNTVYDELRNKKEFDGIKLGLQSLKGVGRLVEVFGIKGEKLQEPNPQDYKENEVEVHTDDEIPSIAIMPFDNKGADEDIFYAYGITSDIISDIAGAGLIRVASQKEIEELGDISVKEKAKNLRSRYICTGALWKMKDIFQLSIELYDTKHSKVVWSDRWQENWENLTTIKETLSKNLLETLNKKSNSVESLSSNNTEAYELYLKAKYRLDRAENSEDIEIATELLEKAINLDPALFEARYLAMGKTVSKGDFSKLKKAADEIIDFAEKSGNKRYQIKACRAHFMSIMGEAFESKEEASFEADSDYVKRMLKHIKDGIKLCLEIDDLSLLMEIKSMKLAVYTITHQTEKAIKISEELLKNYKDLDDEKGVAKTSNIISQSYKELGKYDKAMKLLVDSESYFIGIGSVHNNLERVLLETLQEENLDKTYEEIKKSIEREEMLEGNIFLARAYTCMFIIQFRMGKYSELSSSYEKYKKMISSTSYDCMDNAHDIKDKLPLSTILLALSKKLQGNKNPHEMKKLEELAEKDTEGLPAFWHNYYAYQLFGIKKGRKFLKIAYDKIQEMKSNLKGEELETFLNAYHIKLILNEWEKINN